MDDIGNEIGQKMRSAIKAKLTELGCYVDDELPDYVMVMVANKRTRAQMEDDLQLFLGDNTEMFVNWLHQVLKKLQEVSVTSPLIADLEKKKERSVSKERKEKEKKDKVKSKKGESSKKSKKKEKEKARKKEEKKSNKSKKKSKHEMIRPNIPPLLMNIEKESEPSITDVFAGQILKNHGITVESYKDDPKEVETKVEVIDEIKRPVVPIIDPTTISTQSEDTTVSETVDNPNNNAATPSHNGESQESIQEMNKIEAKIQGLRQKLVEQLDSMSDDDDFLTIRTEAEELMNDFAEDVLQEISQPPPVTPPLRSNKTLYPIQKPIPDLEKPKDTVKVPEILPHIELNLPKRPIRERLGERDVQAVHEVKGNESTKKAESPERFTPEKEIEFRPKPRSSRNRLGSPSESQKKSSVSEKNNEKESSSKRLTSKVSALESRGTRASVGRVRPRVRVGAPASSLLLRAVADAHKSLLNIPPKVDHDSRKIKRAMVLPMRRCETSKIVIQVPGGTGTQSSSQSNTIRLEGLDDSEGDGKNSKNKKKNELALSSITKVINNTEYKGSRTTNQQEHDNVMDTITIHNTTVDKDKKTQFIVTMDGYHPNAFLAKKLLTEGIIDDSNTNEKPKDTSNPELKETQKQTKDFVVEKPESNKKTSINLFRKRLSNTSEESDTQVIIKREKDIIESRKISESIKSGNDPDDSPPAKKRKASPIIFDVDKKEKTRVRERTVSTSSDSHVTITTLNTGSNTHKYDDLPPLSQAERKAVWCRSFPLCRFGSSCVFQHPRCKFAAACTRRACPYSHSPTAPLAAPPAAPLTAPPHSPLNAPPQASPGPLLASHVVPAANYKSISTVAPPSMCKFYPSCVNPTCHYYHPKPCRFGKACTNKLECNFFHNDVPSKWKYSV